MVPCSVINFDKAPIPAFYSPHPVATPKRQPARATRPQVAKSGSGLPPAPLASGAHRRPPAKAIGCLEPLKIASGDQSELVSGGFDCAVFTRQPPIEKQATIGEVGKGNVVKCLVLPLAHQSRRSARASSIMFSEAGADSLSSPWCSNYSCVELIALKRARQPACLLLPSVAANTHLFGCLPPEVARSKQRSQGISKLTERAGRDEVEALSASSSALTWSLLAAQSSQR